MRPCVLVATIVLPALVPACLCVGSKKESSAREGDATATAAAASGPLRPSQNVEEKNPSLDPFEIARRQLDHVDSMLVSDGFLYWNAREAIRRVPVEGGTPQQIYKAADLGTTRVVAADRDHVYFVRDPAKAILRVAKTGGDAETAAAAHAVLATAVDGNDLLYLDEDADVVSLMRVPMGGGAPARVATASEKGHARAAGLAVSGDQVFWLAPNDSAAALRNECQLRAAPKSGGDARLVATYPRQCGKRLFARGDQIVFSVLLRDTDTHAGRGRISGEGTLIGWLTAPAAGGAPKEHPDLFDATDGLVVADESGVAYAARDRELVVPGGKGGAVKGSVTAIALDPTAVYAATEDTVIWKRKR